MLETKTVGERMRVDIELERLDIKGTVRVVAHLKIHRPDKVVSAHPFGNGATVADALDDLATRKIGVAVKGELKKLLENLGDNHGLGEDPKVEGSEVAPVPTDPESGPESDESPIPNSQTDTPPQTSESIKEPAATTDSAVSTNKSKKKKPSTPSGEASGTSPVPTQVKQTSKKSKDEVADDDAQL